MAKRPRLRAIPLGGLGEIGRNMMALEYDENIVVIDAGLMFPEEEMLGVDLVLPDVTYLVERKEKVLGFLLTHGHEDHVGALPYILPKVNAP
ncbi:MAG: MBL fold metallo-hydrolase, partial [Chloroflexi bacterium]